tara:strand:- start:405 stop:662 length:258 start_codon:yes stop_codon:yes gene_type:complete
MASIHDLNTRLTAAKGTDIHKGATETTASSGKYFGCQFLNDGVYTFILDGVTHTSITINGGCVLFGDITSMDAADAADAVALYKN